MRGDFFVSVKNRRGNPFPEFSETLDHFILRDDYKYEHNAPLQSHQIQETMPLQETDRILQDYYKIHQDLEFVIFHILSKYNPQSAFRTPLDNRMYRIVTLDILPLSEPLQDRFELDNSHSLHPDN